MDISMICRFCFSRTRKLNKTPIFNQNVDVMSYEITIFEATGVKVQQNDNLPQNICKLCSNKLRNTIRFRKKCIITQKKILKVLRKNKLHLKNTENVLDQTAYLGPEGLECGEGSQLLGPLDNGPWSERLTLIEGPQTYIIKDVNSTTFEMKINERTGTNETDMQIKNENTELEINSSTFNKSHLNEDTMNSIKDEKFLEAKENLNLEEESIFCEPFIQINKENTKVLHQMDCTLEMNSISHKNNHIITEKQIKNNRKIYSKTNLEKSTISVLQNANRVQCQICLKNLSVKSVYAHMSRFHTQKLKGIKYDICSTYVSNMDEHKKDHRDLDWKSKMEFCDICDKYMLKTSMRMHKLMKHSNMRPTCAHCGKNFGNKNRLKEHLRAKHGYEKFKCASCDYTSANNAAMKDHEMLHRGEKPYVCEACGAKFHARYLLAQHKQSHRDKLVTCNKCPAVFKTNNSLHMHKSACHDTSVYSCQICGRHFRCKNYAKKHLKLTHKFKGSDFPIKEIADEN